MRTYAIEYASARANGTPLPRLTTARTVRRAQLEAEREIASIIAPRAPVEVPKLQIVPEFEPASGVPGFEECAAHGWVKSPHVHGSVNLGGEDAPEPEREEPRIKFGPDGWSLPGTCIDCGAGAGSVYRCFACERANIVACRAGGIGRSPEPRHIVPWHKRPFWEAPAWPGLHPCTCEGRREPHHHNHTLPNKAAVLKQLRKLGATVDADDGTRVYRGPGFEYRFRVARTTDARR